MNEVEFVPEGFIPPTGLSASEFTLEPLGPQHNESDYAAWHSSISHIQATPGYAGQNWPHDMTPDQNRGDLVRHAADFAALAGFTYTVLEPGSARVIGCLYIYPLKGVPHGAEVHSWVTEDRAELDVPLYRAVAEWLAGDAWPFERIEYAAR